MDRAPALELEDPSLSFLLKFIVVSLGQDSAYINDKLHA